LNKISLKSEILFQSKLKIIEELRHVLGVVESLQRIGFNEGDINKLDLKLWDNVSFKYFLSLEIRLYCQKNTIWLGKFMHPVI